LALLVLDCTQFEKDNRPSFEDIFNTLKELHDELEAEEATASILYNQVTALPTPLFLSCVFNWIVLLYPTGHRKDQDIRTPLVRNKKTTNGSRGRSKRTRKE